MFLYYFIYCHQEIRWLKTEIRNMGSEGVRLLDMREREITDMKGHLKSMLKVMDNRIKTKTASSQILVPRPEKVKPEEPHLKPANSKKPPTQTRNPSQRRVKNRAKTAR